jgi:hypothetical protein
MQTLHKQLACNFPIKCDVKLYSTSTNEIRKSRVLSKLAPESVNYEERLLNDAGELLNVTDLADWYKISVRVSNLPSNHSHHQQIYTTGAKNLLKHKYNGSPFQMLSSVYPEHNWLEWKFDRRPVNFWTNLGNQRKFLDWAGKELKIKELDDWYKVTLKVCFST